MSKVKKIILIGHGKIGAGVLSSFELIYGKHESVRSIDTYTKENFNLVNTVYKIIEDNKNNELIIITDLFGGSVNNEFLKYISRKNVHLIAGMNLALVLELVSKLEILGNESVDLMIRNAVKNTEDSVIYCDDIALGSNEKDDNF